jgi:hypothetical protein
MTTLDQMAKAAYEQMVRSLCERRGISTEETTLLSWADSEEGVREDWRAAIRAALAAAPHYELSINLKAIADGAEVKPDAVTE